jgi:hypothetical protein
MCVMGCWVLRRQRDGDLIGTCHLRKIVQVRTKRRRMDYVRVEIQPVCNILKITISV